MQGPRDVYERKSMKVSPVVAMMLALGSLSLSACNLHKEEQHEAAHKIIATNPQLKAVTITQQYVCQIHSQRHIEVRALEQGYLEKISVKEGQLVKAGDVLFSVIPVLYQTKFDAERAEAKLAQLELNYTKTLHEKNVVSKNEVALQEAKLTKAEARAQQAAAELNFTKIIAPYDGIIDRLHYQQGSLVEEGAILTTLSDNGTMWVYFNVPEKAYLEYMVHRKQHEAEDKIELLLANQDKYPYPGKLGNGSGAIEGQFNNQTGNIAFRADFSNPEGVLRHGQTGTILIHRTLKDALIIPQRATFELLDKRYVWVIDADDVAHQRLITIKHELEDIFAIESGLEVGDKIVFEGVREVEEGGKVEYEFRKPEEILKNQKFHAE
jgi:membrane fusion protein, multidrug efflux system